MAIFLKVHAAESTATLPSSALALRPIKQFDRGATGFDKSANGALAPAQEHTHIQNGCRMAIWELVKNKTKRT